MDAMRSLPARTNKPAIVMSVLLTSTLWVVGMLVYRGLVPPSQTDRSSCMQAEDSNRSVTPAKKDSLALAMALAAIASSRPGQQQQSQTEKAEQAGPAVPPRDEPDHFPLSKEEIFAKQKADANTLDAEMLKEEVDPVWSAKVEGATAEAVARIGGSVRLEEVTCRETLCRAKV